MNAWLDVRCRTLWFEIGHPDYTGVTLADALEHEQIYLMPMPTPFDGYVEVLARVSSTCLVTVERNQYSVPCHLAKSKATIHLYADRVDVCTLTGTGLKDPDSAIKQCAAAHPVTIDASLDTVKRAILDCL